MPTYGSAQTLYRNLVTNRNIYHPSRVNAAHNMIREMLLVSDETQFRQKYGRPREMLADLLNCTDNEMVYNLQTGGYIGTGKVKDEAQQICSGLSNSSMTDQFQRDVAMWYGCVTDPGTAAKGGVLKRALLTVQRAGAFVAHHDGGAYTDLATDDIPLASLFSHGGRVMIQLPKSTDRGLEYWRWLWNNDQPLRDGNVRRAATHGHKDIKNPTGNNDLSIPTSYGPIQGMITKKKYVKESGKGRGNHWGINVAMGGDGNMNPYSGQRIQDNGEHGHFYIYYAPPTATKYGVVLFGCEDSAPIDRYNPNANIVKAALKGFYFKKGILRNPFYSSSWEPSATSIDEKGNVVTGWCYGQTGHAHKMGQSGTYSCTGGKKWTDTMWHYGVGPAGKKDGLFCDISQPTSLLATLLGMTADTFDPDTLGRSCNPTAFSPGDVRRGPPVATT